MISANNAAQGQTLLHKAVSRPVLSYVRGRCKEQAHTFYELYDAGEEVHGDDVQPQVSSECEQYSTIMSSGCAAHNTPVAHLLPIL